VSPGKRVTASYLNAPITTVSLGKRVTAPHLNVRPLKYRQFAKNEGGAITRFPGLLMSQGIEIVLKK